MDKTVKGMHDILVKISPFNPLHSDTVAGHSGMSLHPVPSTVRCIKSTEDSVDVQILGELTKGIQEVVWMFQIMKTLDPRRLTFWLVNILTHLTKRIVEL